ncbi:MAG: electron transfer flavoprotein subunit beta/FixA family protein [Bacillota bacterium]
MGLDVVVLVKSVPDPKMWHRITIDPARKTLRKEGIDRVISPLDRHALEAAARLKETYGGTVTALCMGSLPAEMNLKQALALGADQGVFLSDPAFSGADTLTTARPLAAAIRKIGQIDLVLSGSTSYYGSTGQVGPQVAAFLGMPYVGGVKALEMVDGSLHLEAQGDTAIMTIEAPLPVVVGVLKEVNTPRGLRLSDMVRARQKPLVKWGVGDLGLDHCEVGLVGAGTYMADLVPAPPGKTSTFIQGEPEELAQWIWDKVRQSGLLPEGRAQGEHT